MDRATADLIRTGAKHRCEYCKMPQEHDDLPFQFDHIVAQAHDGVDAHENRALACVPCNLYKGTNLSGIDPQTGNVVRLFDPRRQNWKRHFRWHRATLQGRTQCGRATVKTLRINLPIRVEFRQSLMDNDDFPFSDE